MGDQEEYTKVDEAIDRACMRDALAAELRRLLPTNGTGPDDSNEEDTT